MMRDHCFLPWQDLVLIIYLLANQNQAGAEFFMGLYPGEPDISPVLALYHHRLGLFFELCCTLAAALVRRKYAAIRDLLSSHASAFVASCYLFTPGFGFG